MKVTSFSYLLLLIGMGCHDKDIEPAIATNDLFNRIQIYFNSDLQQEFIYDDEFTLIEEKSNFITWRNWCEGGKAPVLEKLVYTYKNGKVDYIDVFNQEKN
jgi:hypothetical protein